METWAEPVRKNYDNRQQKLRDAVVVCNYENMDTFLQEYIEAVKDVDYDLTKMDSHECRKLIDLIDSIVDDLYFFNSDDTEDLLLETRELINNHLSLLNAIQPMTPEPYLSAPSHNAPALVEPQHPVKEDIHDDRQKKLHGAVVVCFYENMDPWFQDLIHGGGRGLRLDEAQQCQMQHADRPHQFNC